MNQLILSSKDEYKELKDFFENSNMNSISIVCTDAINFLEIRKFFNDLSKTIKITYFNEFLPNPTYESVVEGVKRFKESKSNFIVAVGGGSAIDVAKCIKLYANMDENKNYLEQEIISNDISILAVPTTAGTGSEATKYAVIYYNGEKQSISSESCIPKYVLFDSTALKTLPLYQKKATMIDALSHSMESYWSINSTIESQEYSIKALELIIDNYEGYLNSEDEACEKMLQAANIAGKAINITQTTAGHAMCYKLTSLYGIAHGHAAGLVNSELFPYMIRNIDKCRDNRGKDYLNKTFNYLNQILENEDFLRNLLKKLDLYNVDIKEEDIDILVNSVNTTRLKNNPVLLEKSDITVVYKKILDRIKKGSKYGSK